MKLKYPWKWNKYQTFAAIFGGVWRWWAMRIGYADPPSMNQDTANAIAASVAALTSALRAERDALRAECERLRGEAEEQANEKVRAIGLYGLERLKSIRLLRAAQSLHRAWRRDRVSRGCKHGFRSDCRLGCTDYSWEVKP